jgi:molecular chaperone DnaK (HSP70)
MELESRFIVGIDLGTTNCALAYVDTAAPEEQRQVQTLRIPQLVAQGELASLPTLPSFIYLPDAHEIARDLFRLPWDQQPAQVVVGAYARELAAKVPGKVISSAKSWLCMDGVDRRSEILPWDHGNAPRQISPVQATQFFLNHLREAWNQQVARGDETLALRHQALYLTVPASFDAVARELTVEAAEQAGLKVRLLEEPQAAFYAWLERQGDDWRNRVAAGDSILVVDIGGGTTDFSLIAVNDQEGNLELERVAVGNHILLGGDNMDLTLAYAVAERLRRERNLKLDAYQLAALTHGCRTAKETLSGSGSDSPQTLTILGRGSGIIGSTITTELTPADLQTHLLDGFFPNCEIHETPAVRRKMGLRTLGLDYASDPAITKHLAEFLSRDCNSDAGGQPRLPTAVLFNGGVAKSETFRQRIIKVLERWEAEEGQQATVLNSVDLDLAVAYGAAWYGHVRREGGIRIKSGSARSYYLGIESTMPAVPGFAPPVEGLCTVNFGMEEGTSAEIPAAGIGLVVGEPTEFRFFSSTQRPDDAIGTVLEVDDLEEMPPLVAELPADEALGSAIGTLVPVRLRSELTEIGTLQIWCQALQGDQRWKLEFEIRDSATSPSA